MPDSALSSPRRGGRPSRRQAEQLGEAILDAAEVLFLEGGFSGTGMEAIASRAGTSKGTLYARYGSREALFVEVSNRVLRQRFSALPLGEGSLEQQLLALAEQMLAAVLDPRIVRMHAIIQAEATRFPVLARLADDRNAFPGRLAAEQRLGAAIEEGELRQDDPAALSRLFTAMVVHEPLRQVALGLSDFSAGQQRDWVARAVRVFLGGCRG